MKKKRSIPGKILRVLAAVLVAGHAFLTIAIPQSAQAFSGGGTGTAGDPYRITSCSQLSEMNSSNEHFLLRGTLNCSSVSFSPIANFTGVLDGRNHSITNINYTSSGDNVGLFATLNGATIKNLSISSSTFLGRNYVATIAGVAYNNAAIQNVSVASGTIIGDVAAGGLVGEADDGVTIQASSFGGSVTANTTLGGGIAGVLEGSSISNSFTAGVVSGAGDIGGMVGRLSGQNGNSGITNSYSTVTVTNAAGRGGLIGANVAGDNLSITNNFVAATTDGAPALFSSTESGTPTVTNNYFDAELLDSETNCAAGTTLSGCTAINFGGIQPGYFKNNSTNAPFTSWNFTTIWQTNDDYPALRAATLDALDPAVAPGAVSNVRTTPGDSRVNLAWDAPADDGGGEITDYQFSYRVHGTSTWTDTHTNSSYTFATSFGFTNGDHYDFRVAATNSAGTGPYVELLNQIIGTAPGAVQNLQAVNSNGQALVSWNVPSDTGTTPIIGYYVSYKLHASDNLE